MLHGTMHPLVLQALVVVVHSHGQHLQAQTNKTCQKYVPRGLKLGAVTAESMKCPVMINTIIQMLCDLVQHKSVQRKSTSLTFFAAGWPTTHSSKAATISLGVGMSLMPQFMLADVPLKFWPPYWVWPVMTLCVYSWPELEAQQGRHVDHNTATHHSVEANRQPAYSVPSRARKRLLLLSKSRN